MRWNWGKVVGESIVVGNVYEKGGKGVYSEDVLCWCYSGGKSV